MNSTKVRVLRLQLLAEREMKKIVSDPHGGEPWAQRFYIRQAKGFLGAARQEMMV